MQAQHTPEAVLGSIRPGDYARRFMDKIVKHDVRCWFLNTGTCGEPTGRGERIALGFSRTLVRAALSGALDGVRYEADPLFGFEVPQECPGVPPESLDPRRRARDQGDYEMRANVLALDFIRGFERFQMEMPESLRAMVENVPLRDDFIDIMEQVGFGI